MKEMKDEIEKMQTDPKFENQKNLKDRVKWFVIRVVVTGYATGLETKVGKTRMLLSSSRRPQCMTSSSFQSYTSFCQQGLISGAKLRA
jgi:hypothetical protein